ncbi:hypothetical protein A3F02_03395 [Candidatus Curtissbacteria bacterium RIFCSPHIGHO2_12_FULL_38_9b]|uniref:Uncharacterized protein n=1 Tax=Candidatus Curtissbacteria bacterium RIFCSPHIGHO2_12_FULL_38_9b TaxID=1797720 RepID=A0A1F5GTA1_9BACT|nr:MAG: hypothetical protein A3F02_03395 [Candidatus Curtissbacteria bacterium RIFCSPHIGHO2_12_FULL_38_9b]
MKNNLFKIHLLFIFIFLNIWDYAVNRTFFNGMVLGLIMFGPSSFLWFIGTVRAAALITLVSIFEFTMMMVFSLEGFGLSGASVTTLKSLFWLPYLLMAGINSFLGLKIYSEYREKKHKAIT